MKYIRYEVEVRKYSSNALLGVYEYLTEKGERKEKSEFVMAFGSNVKKKIADEEINKLANLYNQSTLNQYFS